MTSEDFLFSRFEDCHTAGDDGTSWSQQ